MLNKQKKNNMVKFEWKIDSQIYGLTDNAFKQKYRERTSLIILNYRIVISFVHAGFQTYIL